MFNPITLAKPLYHKRTDYKYKRPITQLQVLKRPLVSIITVNFNQTEATCALLESLRHQGYLNYEILVVDNGSSENPEMVLKTRFPEITFIRSEKNLGFAGGNNLAVRIARGQFFFFINNDTEVTYFCIDRLVSFCKNHPDCGAVSPLLCYYKESDGQPDVIQYAGMTKVSGLTARNRTIGEREQDAGQFLQAQQTAYAHGAAMMIPRQVVEKVGMMAEDYFLYYEELDWCHKIRKAGYTIWVEPVARMYHKESLTVSRMGALKTYFLFRNRLLFMQRNGSWNILFYIYSLFIVLPKSSFKCLCLGELDNFKALIKATGFFFFGVTNEFELMTTQK